MPLPVAHGLLGASIVAALHTKPTSTRYALPFFAGALLANAADLDFLLVPVLESKAWHRGFTHSIVFAFLICLVFVFAFRVRPLRNAMAYGLAFASHGLLDYLTSKLGGGVQLFWPFSATRLKLGWWGLSEVPSQLTTAEIFQALFIELVFFSVLFLAIVLLRRSLAKNIGATAEG